MKKKILFNLLIMWLLHISAFSQNCASPVLVNNSAHSLCEGDPTPLTLTASISLPVGCRFSNPNNPYRWYRQNSFQGHTLANNNTFSTSVTEGDYHVEVILTDDTVSSTPTCPCIGNQVSNNITVKPKPNIPSIVIDSGCVGASSIITAGSTTPNSAIPSFLWLSQNQNAVLYAGNPFTTPAVQTTTTYHVVENLNGCLSDPKDVTVVPQVVLPPTIPFNTTTVFCNNFATLTASPNGSGIIHWYSDATLSNVLSVGSQFNTPLLSNNTSYYVASKVGDCISSSETITVEVKQVVAPTATAGGGNFCYGQPVQLSATHSPMNTTFGVFEWVSNFTGGTVLHVGSFFPVPSDSLQIGNHNFYVREVINGCASPISNVSVTVNANTPNWGFTSNSGLCERETLTLTATQTIGVTYSWVGPGGFTANTPTINIANTQESEHEGYYTLVLTASVNGCSSTPVSTYVNINALPNNPGIASNSAICEGEDLMLNALSFNNDFDYEWKNNLGVLISNDSALVITNTSASDGGNYILQVTNSNTGCKSDLAYSLVEINSKPNIQLADTFLVFETEQVVIAASGGDLYTWFPNDRISSTSQSDVVFTAPSLNNTTTPMFYNYEVEVLDNQTGCSANASTVVKVIPRTDDQIVIHDLITPDGNGSNDTWDIDFLYQGQQVDVKVFDINNQIVFDYIGSDYAGNKWNGYFKNNTGNHVVPDGAYWYRLEVFFSDKPRAYSGPISVLTGN